MYTTLLRRIEKYLKRTRTAPTRFGREAVRDPQLVFDLRKGRQARRNLETRIHDYIDRQEAMLEAARCRRP
jgi:2,4-dienoyl-CoA reductase-like NADH-dependent reductase (Old Yellow Enzyme family)